MTSVQICMVVLTCIFVKEHSPTAHQTCSRAVLALVTMGPGLCWDRAGKPRRNSYFVLFTGIFQGSAWSDSKHHSKGFQDFISGTPGQGQGLETSGRLHFFSF